MHIRLGDPQGDKSLDVLFLVDEKTGIIDIFSMIDEYCDGMDCESHRDRRIASKAAC